MAQRLSPRNEVADQPSVEVADKDDGGGVVRLGHDGRLPLQVLGDCRGRRSCVAHHLRYHLLVQDASSARSTFKGCVGGGGQLVVAD